MSTNPIEKIRIAEERAEKAEGDARAQAQAVLEAASLEAKAIAERIIEEGEAMLEAAILDARKKAANNSSESKLKAAEWIEKLETAAEGKMDKASEVVKKRLIF